MDLRNLVRWYMNPLVIGGTILLALCLLFITFFIVWVTRPEPTPVGQATPILQVIRIPTATIALPTPTPTGDTIPTTSGPSSGGIAVGDYVRVVGTGGDGLRLRINPGLDGQVRFIAFEGEIFLIQDGPQEADGFTWWHMVGTEDETRRGWSVSEYMEVVQNP